MNNEENQLKVFDGLTPATVKDVTTTLENLVLEGEVAALRMQAMLAATEQVCKNVKATIASYALNEAEEMGEKTFQKYGCKITVKENGTKYDYTECSAWTALQGQIDALTAKRKELEGMLAPYANTGRPFVDAETGEAAYIYKSSTTGVAISLPK